MAQNFLSHIKLGDDVKAQFGDGGDLKIWHDSGTATSYISDQGSGDLYIQADSMIRLESYTGTEKMARFNYNGAVELFYNNSQKFETTSYGTLITGRSIIDTTDNGLNVGVVPLEIGNDVGTTQSRDSWIKYRASSQTNDKTWAIGAQQGGEFRFNYLGTRATSPPNGTNLFKITSAGAATFAGTIGSGNINISDGTPVLTLTDTSSSATATLTLDGVNLTLQNNGTDGDFTIVGKDGSSYINLLAFDTSEGGHATFAGTLGVAGSSSVSTSAITIKSTSASSQQSAIDIIQNGGSNSIIRMGEKSTDGGRLHMFDGGTEKIAFYTDGTNNHISAGNLGVGTNSPNEKLHVYGGHLEVQNAGNTNIYINAQAGSDATLWFQEGGGAKGKIQNDASNDSILITDGANADTMTLKGQKVGIGTSSPDQKLHVEFANTDTSFSGGSGGNWGSDGIRIENTSSTALTMATLQLRTGDADIHIAGIRKDTDDSDLGFYFEGAQKVVFENDGNITTAGTIRVNGTGSSQFYGNIDVQPNKKFVTHSSSSGDYIRLYAGSGTGEWDIYGHGNNLRFSENSGVSGAGVVVDTSLTAGSFVKSGGTSSQYLMADGSVSTGVASHNHDDRYYTETEIDSNFYGKATIDAKFTSSNGSEDEWKFTLGDESNMSGNKWYKVATINQGAGGLHIKGNFSNHVESFGTQHIDLLLQGREGNSGDEIEINGTVNVVHNAGTGTDKVGIRVIEADTTTSQYYHYYDVYMRTTRYTQAKFHLTKFGTTAFHTSKPSVTTEPAPASGGSVELDTSTLASGNHVIVDSAVKSTIADSSGNATFAGNVMPSTDGGATLGVGSPTNLRWGGIELSNGAGIQWTNGDARIIEGLVNNYSLSFQTYDSSTTTLSTALRLDGDNTATFAGNVILENASSPKIDIKDTTNNALLSIYSQNSNSIIGTYSNHPLKLFSNSLEAVEFDTSQNATFAGNINSFGTTNTYSSVLGRHPVHTSYGGLWNTKGQVNETARYMILNAADADSYRTYINGDELYLRAGVNSTTGQVVVRTTGTTFAKDITTNENILVGGDANHNGILTIRSKDSSSVTRQSALKFNIAGTDTVGLTLHNNTSGIATNTLIFDWAGSDKIFFYGNGHITTVDNVTAKIFRDYDNTAYYLDASNTGTSLNVAGDVAAAKGAFTNAIGTLPLTTSTPYDYVAKFESTDSGAYVIIEDNNSTNNANRIGVVGNTMYLQTNASNVLTLTADKNVTFAKSADSNRSAASIKHADNDFLYVKGGAAGISINDDGEDTRMILFNSGNVRFDAGTLDEAFVVAADTGNVTAKGDQINIPVEGTTNKYIYVANDTDYGRAGIGRAALGKLGWDDHAGFAHVDHNGQGGYALLQAHDGDTFINTPTGRTAYFRVNNVTIGSYTTAGLKFNKFFSQANTNYYLDLATTGTSLNMAGSMTMPGSITISGSHSSPGDLLTLYNTNNGQGSGIRFSDQSSSAQKGYIKFYHSDNTNSQGGGALFQVSSTEDDLVFAVGTGDATHGRITVWGGANNQEPDYGFAQDLDTGMLRTGANAMRLVTGGTAALDFDSSQNATFSSNVTVTGNLTVSGTTTTVNQTNLDISDNIIGLNRGANSNSNDSGLIIERGSTGDNAAMIWDEANDRFVFGLTTSTPSATGSVTISATSNLAARNLDVNTISGAATTLTSTTSPILILNPTANNYGGIQFNYGGSVKGISMYNSGFMVFGGESGVDTRIQAGGQYAMHINDSTRNVHIGGTTDATYKLQVNGTLYAAGNTTLAGTLTVQGNANAINLTCTDGNAFINVNHTGNENWQFKAESASGSTDYVSIGASGGNKVKIYEDGKFEHQGLQTLSDGTSIDQVKEYSMTFQLSGNTWTDTGIDGTDLTTGTYAMQVFVDDYGVGGQHYSEYYSGIISWLSSATNSTKVDEIPVHRAGHAPNDGDVQFRTQRALGTDSHDLMLQVKHNISYNAALDGTGSKKMVFKFRRLI